MNLILLLQSFPSHHSLHLCWLTEPLLFPGVEQHFGNMTGWRQWSHLHTFCIWRILPCNPSVPWQCLKLLQFCSFLLLQCTSSCLHWSSKCRHLQQCLPCSNQDIS